MLLYDDLVMIYGRQATAPSTLNQHFLVYSYLQVLDFLTTIAFLLNGVQEGNPAVRILLDVFPTPVSGLLAAKLFALFLGVGCWWLGKDRLLSRMNIFMAALIAWNLTALIAASL